jgi:hypothetical protein
MDFDGISMDFDGILMQQHSMEMRTTHAGSNSGDLVKLGSDSELRLRWTAIKKAVSVTGLERNSRLANPKNICVYIILYHIINIIYKIDM